MPLSVLAAEEEAFVPLTHSTTVRTENGVTVTGTRAMVDFPYLSAFNPDCVGWLYQEDTGLNQAILQCENGYYLDRGTDGSKLSNNKGSVCLDSADSLSARHVVLTGGGRENGCFESLNQYSKQAWLDAHPSLRLITPSGDWHADVFAAFSTRQNDTSWKPPLSRAAFSTWLSGILEKSEIVPAQESVPAYGDRLLILLVNNQSPRRRVVLARMSRITYDTQESADLNKAALDSRETLSGIVDAGPAGLMQYYAQNDPIWHRMRYESARNADYRVFSGGGCGPTAAAIALANVVPAEELPKLAQHTLEPLGTLFCECSVNRVYCTRLHMPYQLRTTEEYLRYLPVALADFAAGNNEWKQICRRPGATGSSIQFLDLVCDIFGVERTPLSDLTQAIELMKEKTGQGVVVYYALRKSPFTNSSHYVVMTGVDEEYFYVLDPLCRTDYTGTDKREILDVLGPGVSRVKLTAYGSSDLSPG